MSSEISAKRATISKALPYYASGVTEILVEWSMRASRESASGAERSSDLTAESWPHTQDATSQAANPQKQFRSVPSEIAVDNNNS